MNAEHGNNNTRIETLQDQFDFIQNSTRNQHAQQFGDLSIAKLPVSQFLGIFVLYIMLF